MKILRIIQTGFSLLFSALLLSIPFVGASQAADGITILYDAFGPQSSMHLASVHLDGHVLSFSC